MKKPLFIITALLALLSTAHLHAGNSATGTYQQRINEALALNDQGHAYRAIVMANSVLTSMEEAGHQGTAMVYQAMGSIFESRGNMHMAEHYYMLALDNEDPEDALDQMEAQSHLALLMKLWKPAEAQHWNAQYANTCIGFPQYRQRHLFVEAVTLFAQNDLSAFNDAYNAYQDYQKEKQAELSDYGVQALEAMHLSASGNHNQALQLLNQPCRGLSQLEKSDVRTIILLRMGNTQQATREQQQRAVLADSLCSTLFFENMSEISTKADIAKTRQEASQQRHMLLYIILVLAALLIIYLGFSFIHFRINRANLKRKNEQLAAALSMAEESDRMKTEFVRSVSHEIRTPLNAINGFNDILNNTDIPLSNEERSDLLKRINENIEAITTIVNELLRMADESSGQYYQREDTIYCNQFLSAFLYNYRSQVNSHTELSYTTKVINRQKIVTNRQALEEVLGHLIQNAIKFTAKGSITVNCSEAGKILLISITDTGTGVAPEMQDKIFEQFSKADSFQQGIGLGLTVSRKIAQRLGGDLILDKQYTTGARFILSLPME